MDRIKAFIEDSRQELKRVNWPTREETVRYTVFVIALSLILAVFLGALDFGFVRGLERVIE